MTFARIPPAEAQALVETEGYELLDVRTVDEFKAGHPAGAFNVPLLQVDPATGMRRPNTNFLDEVRQRLAPETPLIVTCESGGRSARAAALLVENGFEKVADQRAGWGGERGMSGRVRTPGWRDSGLPVDTGDGGERAYRPA